MHLSHDHDEAQRARMYMPIVEDFKAIAERLSEIEKKPKQSFLKQGHLAADPAWLDAFDQKDVDALTSLRHTPN
jgi:hypothetical protein